MNSKRGYAAIDLQKIIVDENDDFWILNKYVGIAINDERAPCTLASESNLTNANSLEPKTDTLVPGLITLFKQQMGVSQAHPVHRLDKETSGLLIVAKHSDSNQALSQAFQAQEVKKSYLAIARPKQGAKPKKKQGWVKGDMKPSRNGNWILLKTQLNPAITHFLSQSLSDRRRLCLLTPQSGKTHQLRVAMKSLSMPICGDKRYGGDDSDRLYLHAYSLQFELFSKRYHYSLLPSDGSLFSGLEFEDALVALEAL